MCRECRVALGTTHTPRLSCLVVDAAAVGTVKARSDACQNAQHGATPRLVWVGAPIAPMIAVVFAAPVLKTTAMVVKQAPVWRTRHAMGGHSHLRARGGGWRVGVHSRPLPPQDQKDDLEDHADDGRRGGAQLPAAARAVGAAAHARRWS